jgi:hypothetical protein
MAAKRIRPAVAHATRGLARDADMLHSRVRSRCADSAMNGESSALGIYD